jgi:hypothetical protein
VESYGSALVGYQPIIVDQVEVEAGVGLPIPVHVIMSGNLSDPCSPVEHTEIKQDGSNFIITLFATPDVDGPAVDGCIMDMAKTRNAHGVGRVPFMPERVRSGMGYKVRFYS